MVEVWKDIEGYEGLYKVSNTGKVYSYKNNKFLSLKGGNSRGYIQVGLYKEGAQKMFCVHKLVAQAFVPNPKPNEFIVVDHLDGNKRNNNANNLEWVTQHENVQRAIRMHPEKWFYTKPNY
jgi:hypothetical protein